MLQNKMTDSEIHFAAIDIGNSRIKLAIEDIHYCFAYDNKLESNLNELFSKSKDKIIQAGFSSVNHIHEQTFIDVIEKYKNINLISIRDIIKNKSKIIYDNIDGIGLDRLLGMNAAILYHQPPLITVDCGTAVTINAVDADYKCLGGVIFAGAYTQMQALANNTDGLHDVGIKSIEHPIGQNTTEAMRAGILQSVAFGIKGIIYKVLNKYFDNKKVMVIFTGGSAEMILESIDDFELAYEYRQWLVLDGIISVLKA